jgi:hypothetical protein
LISTYEQFAQHGTIAVSQADVEQLARQATALLIVLLIFVIQRVSDPFSKTLVEREYGAISRLLIDLLFDVSSLFISIIGVGETRKMVRDELEDYWNQYVMKSGPESRVTTAFVLSLGLMGRALLNRIFRIFMVLTQWYLLAAMAFLRFYRAEPVVKWRLLRFVVVQRRRFMKALYGA